MLKIKKTRYIYIYMYTRVCIYICVIFTTIENVDNFRYILSMNDIFYDTAKNKRRQRRCHFTLKLSSSATVGQVTRFK